jgi:ADP-ribose pyrophosphatase
MKWLWSILLKRGSNLTEEKTISSSYIFKGRAFNVRVDTIINSSGEETTREIVEHADCIAVVPVDDNGEIWLVRQYRKAVGKELLEIPAGGIDPGEDPETAVKRELQEEIGCLPGKVERVGGFYSTPGFTNEYLHLFVASDLRPSRLYAEDTPGIETVRIKTGDILPFIRSEEIRDSKSIAGLLYYLEFRNGKPGK